MTVYYKDIKVLAEVDKINLGLLGRLFIKIPFLNLLYIKEI